MRFDIMVSPFFSIISFHRNSRQFNLYLFRLWANWLPTVSKTTNNSSPSIRICNYPVLIEWLKPPTFVLHMEYVWKEVERKKLFTNLISTSEHILFVSPSSWLITYVEHFCYTYVRCE